MEVIYLKLNKIETIAKLNYSGVLEKCEMNGERENKEIQR